MPGVAIMDDFWGFTAEIPEKSAWGDIYSDFDVGAAFDKYGLLSREEAFFVLKKISIKITCLMIFCSCLKLFSIIIFQF